MRSRGTIRTFALTLVGLGGVPLAAATCSLGEGTTPTCDANLPPTDPNACHQVAPCDDGQGWPKQEDPCCAAYATRVYERCSANVSEDFRNECGTASTDGCCQAAQNDFDLCMAGLLGGGSGGSTGTGGAGGI